MDIKTLTRRLSPYIPYVLALVPVMLFREFTPRNELRYLTIVDEALRDSHFWSFTFEGEPKIYSEKRDIDYDNTKDIGVSIFFDGSGFTAGTYHVELYTDGRLIGTADVALR